MQGAIEQAMQTVVTTCLFVDVLARQLFGSPVSGW